MSRKGTVTEYKNGHLYLSHTEWEDGHVEIELHECRSRLLFHSCDKKELEIAQMLLIDKSNRTTHFKEIEKPKES